MCAADRRGFSPPRSQRLTSARVCQRVYTAHRSRKLTLKMMLCYSSRYTVYHHTRSPHRTRTTARETHLDAHVAPTAWQCRLPVKNIMVRHFFVYSNCTDLHTPAGLDKVLSPMNSTDKFCLECCFCLLSFYKVKINRLPKFCDLFHFWFGSVWSERFVYWHATEPPDADNRRRLVKINGWRVTFLCKQIILINYTVI